jgi:hypothetical protein
LLLELEGAPSDVDVVIGRESDQAEGKAADLRPGFRLSDAIWRRLVWWPAPAALLASVFPPS